MIEVLLENNAPWEFRLISTIQASLPPSDVFIIPNIVNGHNFPMPVLLLVIAEELDIDVKYFFISTKEKDMSDTNEAMKEIKRIVDQFNSK